MRDSEILAKLDRIIQLLEAQAPAANDLGTWRCPHISLEFTTGGMYCRDCGVTLPHNTPTIIGSSNAETKA